MAGFQWKKALIAAGVTGIAASGISYFIFDRTSNSLDFLGFNLPEYQVDGLVNAGYSLLSDGIMEYGLPMAERSFLGNASVGTMSMINSAGGPVLDGLGQAFLKPMFVNGGSDEKFKEFGIGAVAKLIGDRVVTSIV